VKVQAQQKQIHIRKVIDRATATVRKLRDPAMMNVLCVKIITGKQRARRSTEFRLAETLEKIDKNS